MVRFGFDKLGRDVDLHMQGARDAAAPRLPLIDGELEISIERLEV
jgi:hypothetical protein